MFSLLLVNSTVSPPNMTKQLAFVDYMNIYDKFEVDMGSWSLWLPAASQCVTVLRVCATLSLHSFYLMSPEH